MGRMTIEARRIIDLAALIMGALMVLAFALAAPDAEAKKKRPQFNPVQCPTEDNDHGCLGTPANDFLIGGPEDRPDGAYDDIRGGEGLDVYNGGDGSDFLFDESETSSDVYLFPETEFSGEARALLDDDGGGADIVSLRHYAIEDFGVSRDGDDLILNGPGNRDVRIRDFFGMGEIEFFVFRDGVVTGDELASGL